MRRAVSGAMQTKKPETPLEFGLPGFEEISQRSANRVV
jgi:hypothetical protein